MTITWLLSTFFLASSFLVLTGTGDKSISLQLGLDSSCIMLKWTLASWKYHMEGKLLMSSQLYLCFKYKFFWMIEYTTFSFNTENQGVYQVLVNSLFFLFQFFLWLFRYFGLPLLNENVQNVSYSCTVPMNNTHLCLINSYFFHCCQSSKQTSQETEDHDFTWFKRSHLWFVIGKFQSVFHSLDWLVVLDFRVPMFNLMEGTVNLKKTFQVFLGSVSRMPILQSSILSSLSTRQMYLYCKKK